MNEKFSFVLLLILLTTVAVSILGAVRYSYPDLYKDIKDTSQKVITEGSDRFLINDNAIGYDVSVVDRNGLIEMLDQYDSYTAASEKYPTPPEGKNSNSVSYEVNNFVITIFLYDSFSEIDEEFLFPVSFLSSKEGGPYEVISYKISGNSVDIYVVFDMNQLREYDQEDLSLRLNCAIAKILFIDEDDQEKPSMCLEMLEGKHLYFDLRKT